MIGWDGMDIWEGEEELVKSMHFSTSVPHHKRGVGYHETDGKRFATFFPKNLRKLFFLIATNL